MWRSLPRRRCGCSMGKPRRRCGRDRKSTRLNSSHLGISYAVFCLKKKKKKKTQYNNEKRNKDTNTKINRYNKPDKQVNLTHLNTPTNTKTHNTILNTNTYTITTTQ